jgi:predicted TIM-barrel fold metal-dependent hydrolase
MFVPVRPFIQCRRSAAGGRCAALHALADTGHACVKLSGFAKFSAQGHPNHDTRPFVGPLVDACKARALVWASHWPSLRDLARIDFGPPWK